MTCEVRERAKSKDWSIYLSITPPQVQGEVCNVELGPKKHDAWCSEPLCKHIGSLIIGSNEANDE